MKIFRGLRHPDIAPACALTIGNFDGVHRGHQAMIALLNGEAAQRGVPSCALTFEPHPRDYFAETQKKPELAPARIGTLRDKLSELARYGVQQAVVLPFDARLASQSPQAFIDEVLVRGLGARYVLVGDDFRFGKQRAGDYAMLDAAGQAQGFDVARMMSYEVHGLRVSSSEVRAALGTGRMEDAAQLLGRPYAISGHVVHGRKLGRHLGASGGQRGRWLSHPQPALCALEARRQRHLRRPGARSVGASAARRGQPGHPPLAGPERRQRRPRAARNPLPGVACPPGRRRGLR
jgi:riboflavin kinase/FMN adenylyltransferase